MFFFVLFSCTKTDEKLQCADLPLTNITTPFPYNNIFPLYLHPEFNPNNSDEFIVFEKLDSTSKPRLIKYNIKDNQKTTLLEVNVIVTAPRWNLNNWILLTLEDFNVYKISSNGTDLEQLTFTGHCFSGDWINEDKFIYEYQNGNGPLSIISDLNGSNIDSISYSSFSPDWKNGALLNINSHLNVINIEHNEKIASYEINMGGITSARWINDNEVFWTAHDGLFITNIKSGLEEKLIETCNSSYFLTPSYHEKDKLIIAIKLERSIEDITQKLGTAKTRIFLYDLNGKELISFDNL